MWKTYCPYCHGYTKDDERGNCAACGAQRIHTTDTSPLPKEIPEKSWSESPSATSSEEASKSKSLSLSISLSRSPSQSPSPEDDEIMDEDVIEPMNMDEEQKSSYTKLMEWIEFERQRILKAKKK